MTIRSDVVDDVAAESIVRTDHRFVKIDDTIDLSFKWSGAALQAPLSSGSTFATCTSRGTTSEERGAGMKDIADFAVGAG